MTESEKEGMMHVALPIGNGNVLMATDAVCGIAGTKSNAILSPGFPL